LRIAYCVLRIAYCVLRIAYCVLRLAYCVLRIASCVLRIAYCVLRIAFCVLRFAFCVFAYCVWHQPNHRWSGMTNHEKIRKHLHRPSMSLLCVRKTSHALFGFLMVPETSLGSPRAHPSHSPTLAGRRSPSRSASTTSSNFKDALEHLLEDAAWGLPHAAVSTNHEQLPILEPCTPSFHAAHIRRRSCKAPVRNTADSL